MSMSDADISAFADSFFSVRFVAKRYILQQKCVRSE